MLTKEETSSLKNYLSLAPNPEGTFTFEELQGYLFGLAMTPGILLPSDWVPVIFGDEVPVFDTEDQVEAMHSCLIQVYSKLSADFQEQNLHFPFDLNNMDSLSIEDLYAWVSGFEEALSLQEDVWDPEEFDQLPPKHTEQLYHSLMTIQGLVDPAEVMDFFENMPLEAFQEVFPDQENSPDDREVKIQMFLLASLPLAVQTLQKHCRLVEGKLIEEEEEKRPERKNNGSKKSNVIPVDFGKKK